MRLFLIFLNSHARNLPSIFVGFDNKSFGCNDFPQPYVHNYTMIFTGRNNAEHYDGVLEWGEHREALDWLRSGPGLSSANGLCVMEIQVRISGYLLDCCASIMQIPPAMLGSSQMLQKALAGFDIQPKPLVPSTSD